MSTVRFSRVEWAKAPDWPVIVTANVPVGVPFPFVVITTVEVAVPFPGVGVGGLKEQAESVGKPEQERPIEPANAPPNAPT